MNLDTIFGAVAGTISSVTFLPQVIKIYKTKSAKDLSLWTLFFLALGVALWLVYGILKADAPLIITNAIVLSMIFIMLYFKLSFKD